ncbi:aminotransferase class I/II-fold pyridoxal phosphate-dependent enzyme [Aquipuribacter hungaricus]|uniref:Aminotransferase n=1 Tax=Aquipuribacter hungaricus TaxID=545624 RepID=A0ABV7WAH4_9MICO
MPDTPHVPDAADVARLSEHGDTQVPPGHVDLAVNVHPDPPPGLAEVLTGIDVRAYPDPSRARAAVAARHGVGEDHVLLTNGAAEAFWALAHAHARAHPAGVPAACVHPSFTAPEAALRSAGVPVRRVVRRWQDGFRLDPAAVPEDAGLVVLGRPDNPTGRSEDVDVLASLRRPGRLLVVDEAFAEHRGDGLGLTGERGRLPGLVQVRSLTKVWGAAGLRLGYVVADPGVVRRLAAVLQPWPVGTVALAVLERLLGPAHAADVEVERRRRAAVVDAHRDALVPRLRALGLTVHAGEAPYLLLHGPVHDLRERLLGHGLAVRRCDTFPGLDGSFVRVAVPAPPVADLLVDALAAVLAQDAAGTAHRPAGVAR